MPDRFNEPTAATVLRNEYTITSDAAGQAVWAEHPAPGFAKCTWTVTAGTTAAGPTTTAHPQAAAFAADARFARTVAIKVTVTYIASTMATAGYLTYFTKTDSADISSQSVDGLHTGGLSQARADVPITIYGDPSQELRWEAPGVANTAFMAATHKFHAFAATGLPASTAVFRVRICRFMEYLPLEGSLAEGETKHEPYDPGATAVMSQLAGPATSVQRGGGNDFINGVKSAANAAYHLAQPLIPYVAHKARSYLQSAFVSALPMLMG